MTNTRAAVAKNQNNLPMERLRDLPDLEKCHQPLNPHLDKTRFASFLNDLTLKCAGCRFGVKTHLNLPNMY